MQGFGFQGLGFRSGFPAKMSGDVREVPTSCDGAQNPLPVHPKLLNPKLEAVSHTHCMPKPKTQNPKP